MFKDDIFQILETQFLTYKDLSSRLVKDNGEKMVSLKNTSIHSTCLDVEMRCATGDEIYVREGVLERLCDAQTFVDQFLPGHKLDVFYGYRSLEIQKESFQSIKEKILRESSHNWEEADLMEAIHRFIAVPDVAGHPTGGAVDVRLLDENGQALDMGTKAHEFVKESYVFFPLIDKAAWNNRQKLRQCMLAAGFAPFDGEWWHFSYGDREWAAYYNKQAAIYTQIEF